MPASSCCCLGLDRDGPTEQQLDLAPNGLFELIGTGTFEVRTIESRPQPHNIGGLRQGGFEKSCDAVDLPFEQIARDRTPGPALGNHGSDPSLIGTEEFRLGGL